jgi:hypothetical protein
MQRQFDLWILHLFILCLDFQAIRLPDNKKHDIIYMNLVRTLNTKVKFLVIEQLKQI